VKPKVLAVDDDRLLRMSVQFTFEEQGYDVDTAANVDQALDALDSYRYALVLTDLTLPDGDGLEVIRYALRRNPDSKVILMTASEEDLDADAVLLAGASEVLFKPCKLSLLVTRAREILRTPTV
jgi:DNA-binding response OmpR family regulator